MNYSELQSAIESWINRNDLTDEIPGFIELCEAEVNRQLRTGDQENEITPIPGVDGQSVYDLTETEKGWRTVKVDRILRYVTPHALDAPPYYKDRVYYYTLFDNKIAFNQALTDTQQIELLGYSQVPALTDTETTNWLLEDHEDVYLFGSLRYAHYYAKAYAKGDKMQQLFEDKMVQVIERDKRDRWSGDTLQMRSNRPRGVGRSRSMRCR